MVLGECPSPSPSPTLTLIPGARVVENKLIYQLLIPDHDVVRPPALTCPQSRRSARLGPFPPRPHGLLVCREMSIRSLYFGGSKSKYLDSTRPSNRSTRPLHSSHTNDMVSTRQGTHHRRSLNATPQLLLGSPGPGPSCTSHQFFSTEEFARRPLTHRDNQPLGHTIVAARAKLFVHYQP